MPAMQQSGAAAITTKKYVFLQFWRERVVGHEALQDSSDDGGADGDLAYWDVRVWSSACQRLCTRGVFRPEGNGPMAAAKAALRLALFPACAPLARYSREAGSLPKPPQQLHANYSSMVPD